MKEMIFKIGDALYNEDTGEAVFKPKVVGELIRCKGCVYWMGDKRSDGVSFCCYYRHEMPEDGFCSKGIKK